MKFITVIKENESLVTAKEYKNNNGRMVGRIQEDPKTLPGSHYLCGKVHKRGQCTQQCSGCKKRGSHLEENCWVLYPAKKPDFGNPKKGRGRGRDRTRSKSRESEDTRTRKKGREQSPSHQKL